MKTIKFIFIWLFVIFFIDGCSANESELTVENMISIYNIEIEEDSKVLDEISTINFPMMVDIIEDLQQKSNSLSNYEIEILENHYGENDHKKILKMVVSNNDYFLKVYLNFNIDSNNNLYFINTRYEYQTDEFIWKGYYSSLSTKGTNTISFECLTHLYFSLDGYKNQIFKVPLHFSGTYNMSTNLGNYHFYLENN